MSSSKNSNEDKVLLNRLYGKMAYSDTDSITLGKLIFDNLSDEEKKKYENFPPFNLSKEEIEELRTIFHTANALDMRQGAPKGTSMYTLYEQSIQGWSKLPNEILDKTVRELQDIIDDGLTNGFEFRLQGSTIIFREVQH